MATFYINTDITRYRPFKKLSNEAKRALVTIVLDMAKRGEWFIDAESLLMLIGSEQGVLVELVGISKKQKPFIIPSVSPDKTQMGFWLADLRWFKMEDGEKA
jgi:hypothetical protein